MAVDLTRASEVSEKGGSLEKGGRIADPKRLLPPMSSCPGSELAAASATCLTQPHSLIAATSPSPACSSLAAHLARASMDGAVLGRLAWKVSGGGGEKNEPVSS
jgi:hypothetical protein